MNPKMKSEINKIQQIGNSVKKELKIDIIYW